MKVMSNFNVTVFALSPGATISLRTKAEAQGMSMTNHMSRIDKLINEKCPDGVEFRELGELGVFYGGLTGKSKDDFTDGKSKFVTYMNVFSNIAVDTNICSFVKVGEKEKQNRIQYGDILFTGSSETPNECGMSSVMTEVIDEPLYLNSFCFGFRLNELDLFLPGFPMC